MRLINVKTLKFEEFYHEIPPYAILSHTWGDEEVTFQDYLVVADPYSNPSSHIRVDAIKRKAGFSKIMSACKRAREDKLEFLWCDTNCIDKSSSAELTEAINSMYTWYHNSEICYAYLSDVAVFDTTERGAEEFGRSRWFTRGWTLQELLAPKEVLFFNKGWEPIAARRHLAKIIRGITRIHNGALLNRNTIQEYSVAQRMSWAAYRRTSRQEDIAYCLLGIFGVNMPLLYGEGWKAFTRLQEEIIKSSDDQSILTWSFPVNHQRPPIGMLASSPCQFACCGSIVRRMDPIRSPYSMTNLGISLELPMIQTLVDDTVLVELNCCSELQEYRPRGDAQVTWRCSVWIWLRSVGHNLFIRSPYPTVHTSLVDLYPYTVDCPNTKLFGVTSSAMVEPWASNLFSPISNNGTAPTGFHVVLGFGRIRQRTGTFEDVFPPGNFTVHKIPPTGSPGLSHEVISSGSYVVLLSMAWGDEDRPEYWQAAILMGQNESTIRTMSVDSWSILFNSHLSPSSLRMSGVDRVQHVHNHVRKLTNQPRVIADNPAMPLVNMEKRLWEDHHGEVKVIVYLTFQEVTKLQSVP